MRARDGLSPEDRRRCQPVWTALSELFLDTELSEADDRHIACVLANSGYSTQELTHILCDEVTPVVGSNLIAPAGVWSGVDDAWLSGQATRQTQHVACPLWLRLRRWWQRRLVRPAWQCVLMCLPEESAR
ncbi:DUF7079 family protein [Deinococcus peraridilitoris]|uniref:DUF7079 domain-containing protein n=1 Tax=Deinococcus peraridilitoris (strain DSM 19664 / LMG 22246 / CIP 109416 / KR-200) TaxID=937777 RepID=L0A7E4_DEIPD|nr:hypothetical protein Deipe_3971 [Deinococcus peraridilitoris DSM 19664]